MTKYFRYSLAALCLAASVACIGLWWRSFAWHDQITGGINTRYDAVVATSFLGSCEFRFVQRDAYAPPKMIWRISSKHVSFIARLSNLESLSHSGFAITPRGGYFPLWFPALIFALAGVGILRLGKRFTLRSALVATTVVAGLLGMAVAL